MHGVAWEWSEVKCSERRPDIRELRVVPPPSNPHSRDTLLPDPHDPPRITFNALSDLTLLPEPPLCAQRDRVMTFIIMQSDRAD